MATSKATIKAALLSLENDARANAMNEDTYCDRLAGIIQDAIKSGTVNTGISVQVSTSSGTGATTGTGTIS